MGIYLQFKREIYNNIVCSKNHLFFFSGQALSSILAFVLLPFYTKYLSLEEYGLGTLVLVILPLHSTVFSFGLNIGFMIRYFKIDMHFKKVLLRISYKIPKIALIVFMGIIIVLLQHVVNVDNVIYNILIKGLLAILSIALICILNLDIIKEMLIRK